MWARICEALLGLWLFISYFLTPEKEILALIASLLIIVLALICYVESLNKMHLLQIVPASLLLYLGYVYPTAQLPLSYQNYVLIALTLLVFCIIPSNASDHPRAWKEFLKKFDSKEK